MKQNEATSVKKERVYVRMPGFATQKHSWQAYLDEVLAQVRMPGDHSMSHGSHIWLPSAESDPVLLGSICGLHAELSRPASLVRHVALQIRHALLLHAPSCSGACIGRCLRRAIFATRILGAQPHQQDRQG